MTMISDSLFDDLVHHTKADVDRHGEAHIACPECGHESSRKNPHCSFSRKGFYCFVCGAAFSLPKLAERLGLGEHVYSVPTRPQEAPRQLASWLADAECLVKRYVSRSDSWTLWRAYKPVSRRDFERCRLGVGQLPFSACKHERLIVPVIDGTQIVGLRGRALSCNCAKWLAPGGTLLDLYPLYNAEMLRPGCTAWIVENPIDALLMEPRTGYIGVATYSVSYWRDAWLDPLRQAEMVVVAYDNDLPGNGGAARRGEFMRDWLRSHPRIPPANGVKLVNRLLAVGIKAVLYDWGRADCKMDIGSMIGAVA